MMFLSFVLLDHLLMEYLLFDIMKQKYNHYYCTFLHRDIGDGMVCFSCSHFTREMVKYSGQECYYEKVLEYNLDRDV